LVRQIPHAETRRTRRELKIKNLNIHDNSKNSDKYKIKFTHNSSAPLLLKLLRKQLCVIVFLFTSCIQAEPSRTEFALGTICTITLYDQAKDSVYNDIFERINEIENLMSVNISTSDVSRINEAAGTGPVQVSEDVFKVIQRAVYFADLSGGAFDPTVGPLTALWAIGTDNEKLPSPEEIDAVLPLINWQDIELDPQMHTVFLKRSGMALDLGAIAKGYAADEAAAIIKEAGIKQAIVDLGGNIIVCGEKKDKSPWRVGIQHPGEGRGTYFGVLSINAKDADQTIVTSGVNERYFVEDGVRYHHIFSTVTGYPASNGLMSVTVVTTTSMDADALSTAIFVLGYEKGHELISSIPGAEAVFIFEDYSVLKTNGAAYDFK
jgi:thiamine biosynthesis lipoprotein